MGSSAAKAVTPKLFYSRSYDPLFVSLTFLENYTPKSEIVRSMENTSCGILFNLAAYPFLTGKIIILGKVDFSTVFKLFDFSQTTSPYARYWFQ